MAERPAARDDDAMLRSEEELVVHLVTRPVERVRIRRRVVTEEVTITVPVSREELTVERIPLDGAEPVAGHHPAGDDELVIVLRAERPVVEKRVEPVELVRVRKERVTETREIRDTVRREEVKLDRVGPGEEFPPR